MVKYKLLQLYPGSPYGFKVGDIVESMPHCLGDKCRRSFYINHRGNKSNKDIRFEDYPNIWEIIKNK